MVWKKNNYYDNRNRYEGEYNLRDITPEGGIDKQFTLTTLVNKINMLGCENLVGKRDNLNAYISGINTLERNLQNSLNRNDLMQDAINENKRWFKLTKDIQAIYERLGLLHILLDEHTGSKIFEAGDHLVTDYVTNIINKSDRNFIFGIFGQPRRGKSWFGLRMAQEIDPNFSIKNIVYSFEDYMNRTKELDQQNKLKGSVMIMDEAGYTADAQSWWDKNVKRAVNVLRQQGYQNTCLICVTPVMTDIAKKARQLFHAYARPHFMEIKVGEIKERYNIDDRSEQSMWRFYFGDTDPLTGNQYKHMIKVDVGKIKILRVSKPTSDLVKGYKKLSREMKDKIQEVSLLDSIKERSNEDSFEVIQSLLKIIFEDPTKYISRFGRWDKNLIRPRLGLKHDICNELVSVLKKDYVDENGKAKY